MSGGNGLYAIFNYLREVQSRPINLEIIPKCLKDLISAAEIWSIKDKHVSRFEIFKKCSILQMKFPVIWTTLVITEEPVVEASWTINVPVPRAIQEPTVKVNEN